MGLVSILRPVLRPEENRRLCFIIVGGLRQSDARGRGEKVGGAPQGRSPAPDPGSRAGYFKEFRCFPWKKACSGKRDVYGPRARRAWKHAAAEKPKGAVQFDFEGWAASPRVLRIFSQGLSGGMEKQTRRAGAGHAGPKKTSRGAAEDEPRRRRAGWRIYPARGYRTI